MAIVSLTFETWVPAGRELERMAQTAGFETAKHFELAGGLMGCLVAQKIDA